MAALRFGVVGTAHWARNAHLPGLIATLGARVVGLWGRTPTAAAEVAAQHGITPFGSFDAMLDAVDAVTIAVPPEAQAKFALRAAEAGKHMILEKPIALDAASARDIAAAVRRAGVASLVFFLRRFQPQIAAAVASEAGQRWTRAEVRVHSAALASASPYASSVWRQDEGAALWDIGPHVLSMLLPLLGDVTEVEAWPEQDGICRVRTVHAHGSAEISVSLRSPADQISNWYRLLSPSRDILLPDPVVDRVAIFSHAARRLLEMVETGETEDPLDASFGADIVEVLAAADRSAREGRPIEMHPDQ